MPNYLPRTASSTHRWRIVSVLGALVCITSGALAQVVTVNGQSYEAAAWPAAPTADTATGSWSTVGSGGTISASSTSNYSATPTRLPPFSTSGTSSDFNNAAFGAYAINGVHQLRPDIGQDEPLGGDMVTTYTLTGVQLPTEVLYYVGGSEPGAALNGMKFARWAWASATPGTTFELVTASASVQDITGSGTAALSWRTFGTLNNLAVALVRVRNPAGVRGFSITSNRLSTTGAANLYPGPVQRTDFSPTALLIGGTQVASTAPNPVPVGGTWPLAVLMLGVAALAARTGSAKLNRSGQRP